MGKKSALCFCNALVQFNSCFRAGEECWNTQLLLQKILYRCKIQLHANLKFLLDKQTFILKLNVKFFCPISMHVPGCRCNLLLWSPDFFLKQYCFWNQSQLWSQRMLPGRHASLTCLVTLWLKSWEPQTLSESLGCWKESPLAGQWFQQWNDIKLFSLCCLSACFLSCVSSFQSHRDAVPQLTDGSLRHCCWCRGWSYSCLSAGGQEILIWAPNPCQQIVTYFYRVVFQLGLIPCSPYGSHCWWKSRAVLNDSKLGWFSWHWKTVPSCAVARVHTNWSGCLCLWSHLILTLPAWFHGQAGLWAGFVFPGMSWKSCIRHMRNQRLISPSCCWSW